MSENTPTVSLQAYLRSGSVQERLEALMKDRASDFTASLMSVVNANPVLQQCAPDSVLKAAITAAAMKLPLTPGLGFAFIIPYLNNKKTTEEYVDGRGVTRTRDKWVKVYEAQFQMGYKGFIQLAQRSGHYSRINATDVREGELTGKDRLSGELSFAWIEDDKERLKLPIVGYVAYFKLSTGFTKELFMTSTELTAHAKKYSKSFSKGGGLWGEDDGFAFMATKTVLKLLISRFGPMTTDMEKAILADQAADPDADGYNYVDNDHGKQPPAPDDTDQTPTAPTEAEADQTPVTAKPAKKATKKKRTSVKKKTAKKKPTDDSASITEEVTASDLSNQPYTDKDKEQIGARLNSQEFNARGRMAFLNKYVGKPTVQMIKTLEEWHKLNDALTSVESGAIELDADWYAEKQNKLI